MVFSSTIFLFVFLPLVLGVYAITPRVFKNLILLIASLIFYAWGEGFFVLIMLASISINYVAGVVIAYTKDRPVGWWCLCAAVVLNLSLLVFFKYANFLVANVNSLILALSGSLGGSEIIVDPVHLPIGISFFTFQAISYVVDVYRGDAEAQKNPISASLYIALFPQLIAGPIVRYRSVAAQLKSRSVTLDDYYVGVSLFIVGLGKKMLIANPMGETADAIFALEPQHLNFTLSWLGVIAYTLQIYFDFSGYSDMALGLGRLFGFTFPINFNYPYIARSMREFWRRWHISLSRWFRDYVYIPLGGNRCSPARVYANLAIVFALCGLWHGASWNFLLWGVGHGVFLALERTRWGDVLIGLWSPLRWLYMILIVMLTWVLFRTETMEQAAQFYQAMAGAGAGQGVVHYAGFYMSPEKWLTLVAGLVFATPVMHRLWSAVQTALPNATLILHLMRNAALMLILFACCVHLAAGTHNPFIYFRF